MTTRPLLTLLASRIAAAAATILVLSLLVFLLIHLIPGDPVEAMLGEQASAADRAALREALGLDAPLSRQVAAYYGRLARLDLGTSLYGQQPVASLLRERLPYTCALAGAALSFAILLALPVGIAAARHVGQLPDHFSSWLAVLGGGVPGFVLGPVLLVVFAVQLGWVPIGGADTWSSVLLPAATLGLGLAAALSRQLRAALLAVFAEDYIRAAAARGLRPREIMFRHALRNAALPVLTVLGLQLAGLLGGVVITETVFSWPGLGTLTVEAIERRDYPVLQGCVLVISTAYVIVNLLTDSASAMVDPRLCTNAGAAPSS
jgi:peptide/nickel transport system permease protein